MHNIKAVIFDLDGTLLDTLTSLWYCANRSLKKEGLAELPKENFRYYVGDGALTQVERYLKDTYVSDYSKNPPNPQDPANLDYYYKSYMEELSLYADYEVKPYDGIMETLKKLRDMGIVTAVFSNKPDAAAQTVIHKHFGDTFRIVLGKKDGMAKKPDPEGALMIAGELGTDPGEILYIGDTDTDMKTGRNAGMFTVGAAWGFRGRKELEDNGADAVIDEPAELLAFISGSDSKCVR